MTLELLESTSRWFAEGIIQFLDKLRNLRRGATGVLQRLDLSNILPSDHTSINL